MLRWFATAVFCSLLLLGCAAQETRSGVPVAFARKPPVAPDLSNMAGAAPLSERVKQMLVENGFAVELKPQKQIFSFYIASGPLFITTDSILDGYHWALVDALRVHACRELKPFLDGMLKECQDAYNAAKDGALKEAAARNYALFLLLDKLLERPRFPGRQVPDAFKEKVAAEAQLVLKHEGAKESAIFGYPEDYSQYEVRGIYRSNTFGGAWSDWDEVEAGRFIALMYLSRMGFRLKSESETLSALLLVRILSRNRKLRELHGRITEPFRYFGGEPNHLAVAQYEEVMKEVYGENAPVEQLGSKEKVTATLEKLWKLPDPKVNSMWLTQQEFLNFPKHTKGLRLVPKGLSLEHNVFRSLTYPETGRLMPSGLDVFAALGVPLAAKIQTEGSREYPEYKNKLAKLKKQYSHIRDIQKPKDHPEAVLWMLSTLSDRQKTSPYFMKSEAWQAKSLNTALSSWAEIVHDTILYRESHYGVGGMYHDYPGYVEPNVEFYRRLKYLAETTARHLGEAHARHLLAVAGMCERLAQISGRELAGEPLPPSDMIFIENYGKELAAIQGYSPNQALAPDRSMRVIADVFTETAVACKTLEVGVGDAFPIYVILNVDGKPLLARGGVMSYFEFHQPMFERLTDDEWRKMELPDLAGWQYEFVAPDVSRQLLETLKNPPSELLKKNRLKPDPEQVLKVLAEAIAKPEMFKNATARETAVKYFTRNCYEHGEITRPALIELLKDKDFRTRYEAARMLARHGFFSNPPEIQDILSEAVEGEDLEMRHEAICMLYKKSGKARDKYRSLLLEWVMDTQVPEKLRKRAVWALTSRVKQWKPPEFDNDTVCRLLASDTPEAVNMALTQLSCLQKIELDEKKVAALLEKALNEGDLRIGKVIHDRLRRSLDKDYALCRIRDMLAGNCHPNFVKRALNGDDLEIRISVAEKLIRDVLKAQIWATDEPLGTEEFKSVFDAMKPVALNGELRTGLRRSAFDVLIKVRSEQAYAFFKKAMKETDQFLREYGTIGFLHNAKLEDLKTILKLIDNDFYFPHALLALSRIHHEIPDLVPEYQAQGERMPKWLKLKWQRWWKENKEQYLKK